MLSSRKRKRPLNAAATGLAALIALAFTLAPAAHAQMAQENDRATAQQPPPEAVQTFFLKNVSEQNELNDIQTDLRNVMPRARIYGIQTQNAITVKGTPDDLATAQKLISELDRPCQLYRLTYTITDIDGGKRAGSQQFVILAAWEQRSDFKQGSRVPIVTGSTTEGQSQNTQVQYQDLGLNIEATVGGSPDAITLRTNVQQSSLDEEKPIAGAQDPVIRQTVLRVTVVLVQGKPLVLGSLDIPGTTRREEIAVTADLVH